METKNIDGETNLKHKQANKKIMGQAKDILDGTNCASVTCEEKNESIYTFQGKLTVPGDAPIPLTADEMMLRGSSLRNTEWAIGIAVYTGHDTKVMMNQSEAPNKMSRIERASQGYITLSIGIQLAFCVAAAAYVTIWFNRPDTVANFSYLSLDESFLLPGTRDYILTYGPVAQILIYIGRWFLVLQCFVSISMLVTLEMVKFFQGVFMERDWMMFDVEKDMPMKVQSSNLNEELGTVKYVFSDKTGTLTQNIMEFKKFSAGGESYGTSNPEPVSYAPGVTNVNFTCEKFDRHWTQPQ